MSIKDRWQRLLSRKSLSSTHSSASSTTSSTSTAPTSPSSSGTSTPTPTTTASSARAPPALDTSPTTPPSPSKPSPSAGSFLSKTLTWRSSHGNAAAKPEKESARSSDRREKGAPAARRRVHPSERPLTEANLRQQEMLAGFKWEFGRRGSVGGESDLSGISPCCSRTVPPVA